MAEKTLPAQQLEGNAKVPVNPIGPKTVPDNTSANSSNDINELKKRLDKSEKELRAMSEAMKTTLVDVRAMVQELDNPFNLLKDMGVDKLVNKAVEEVENGVNKAKRDEAMKRMGNPNAIPEEVPHQKTVVDEDYFPLNKKSNIETRMDVMESVLKDMTETFDMTLDEMKSQSDTPSGLVKKQAQFEELDESSLKDGNYTAYIQLVAEYLALRFGRRGAERILLNEVTKNQSSPKVVRDILDSLAVRAVKDEDEAMDPRTLSISLPTADLDDKIMITLLLKSLDKPLSEWGSIAILYLLTVLVKRSTEVKLARG
jgi:hypothetical protein